MPNYRKVNSNGAMPSSPYEERPQDDAVERDVGRAMSTDVIHVREAQRSHEMMDDLELADAQREKRRGVGIHTTKAPWLTNPGK